LNCPNHTPKDAHCQAFSEKQNQFDYQRILSMLNN
jgi:hypothetical protein